MINAIQLTNIYKTFYSNNGCVKALENVSLNIEKGTIWGIFGPNGSGKTTLLKIISTLILPDSGKTGIAGFNILNQSHQIRSIIGFASGEERGFYGRLTVKQNLEFFGKFYNLNNNQLLLSINSLSESLGLNGYINTAYQKCSSGIKQRVSLAKSLLNDPEILLIDEFNKSLDPLFMEEVMRFLKTLSQERKKTILLTSHNLSDIESICTHAALLESGKITRHGSVNELTNKGSMPLKNLFSEKND